MKHRVLVTGGAGFIGSNICEKLLAREDVELVRVIDNFVTGFRENIEPFIQNRKFEFLEADIRDYAACLSASKEMNFVLHQAALGSVPRSIANPITTNEFNITGTLNIFFAAKESNIRKLVFASSSSTYGNNSDATKKEDQIGDPLSPYAVTKRVIELYAKVFSNIYEFQFIGLRYFNVFGPRQSPKGAYAAVIPIFFREMMNGRAPVIHGNGEQSRDFTFVENVVDANILTLLIERKESWNQIYNIALGSKTSLIQLYHQIASLVGFTGQPIFGPERKGDIRDSLADISHAKALLGYQPSISVRQGLEKAFSWYQLNPAQLES